MLVFSDKIIFLITSIMTQALRVLTTFAMARLLRPEDYGLLTLVALAPSFLAALGDCGIARALVQYRDLPTEVVEASGLTVSVALGGIYTALWLGSGFYLGFARHDQRLAWIGIIGGVTLMLSTIYTFQMACLNRDLKFRAESRQNIIFALALTVTGLSLALVAHWHPRVGVFALATQPLAAQIMGNVMIYRRHPFHWPRAFQSAMARKMLNYGWKVTIAQYANNLQQAIVSTFVAVVGGAVGLGVYGRATNVSDMVGFNMMVPFDRLLHPLMRSIRDDEDRLRDIFIRGCIGSMLLCCFSWAWLLGTSTDLIRVVMGPQWGEVPPLLRIVSAVLPTIGLGTMAVIIFHALGKPLIWLRFMIVNLIVLSVTVSIALIFHRAMASIAAAWAFSQTVTSFAMWIWVTRRLKIAPANLIGHLVRIMAVAVVACVCMLFLQRLSMPQWLRLMVESGVGAGVFIGLAFLLDREAIAGFRSLLPRRAAVAEPVLSPTMPVDNWQGDV